MKTISAALQAFLVAPPQSGMQRADLVTITLPNSQVLNIVAGYGGDIVYGGTRYYCSKYGAYERGPFTNKASFTPSADSMELTALIKETFLFPGTTTPLMQVVNSGVLSGSTVFIQTLFWPAGIKYDQTFTLAANLNVGWAGGSTSGVAMGSMVLTLGQLGAVKPAGRSKVVCEIFDLTYILNRRVPPLAIQSACNHTVFDAGCGLNVSNFQSTNVVLDVTSTNLNLNLDIPARANGTPYVFGNLIVVGGVIYMCTTAGTSAGSAPTFNSPRFATTADGSTLVWTSQNEAYPLGYILYTGGQNAGLKWSIKAQAISSGSLQQLQLLKPLPFPVAAGDTIQLIPGCLKTIANCIGFNNLIHIMAAPFVPNPETSI
jgi:hypothetical protein